MLKDHLYGLFSRFDALTEDFNTTIQALKATAKGYRNFENFRTEILSYCGKPDMRPDLVRVGATLGEHDAAQFLARRPMLIPVGCVEGPPAAWAPRRAAPSRQ